MPVAAAAAAVTVPITSPGSCSSKSSSRRSRNCSNSAASLLQSQASDVDRPLQEDVVRGRVAERAGEAVAEIARGCGRVREGRVVGEVGEIGAVVHPADHRLDERSVCPEERLAAADRAEADGRDLAADRRRSAAIAWRLAAASESQRSSSGWKTTPCLRPAHRAQRLAGPRRRRALGVDDDDLRALRAAVDADQVRAARHAAPRPRPSGRGSRRPPRGRAR